MQAEPAVAPSPHPWRARIWVALALYGLTTLWSFRWVSESRAGDDLPQRDIASALDRAQALVAVFLGPFLGPFARHWQPCGIGDSHRITVGLCAGALSLGLALQFLPLPAGRGAARLRLCFWSLGWTLWFGGACASLLHWFG
jgi:hypothetical protein